MNSKKPDPKTTDQKSKISHPGMMGDGTEEQNLNETGDPSARITQEDVDSAFKDKGKDQAKKK